MEEEKIVTIIGGLFFVVRGHQCVLERKYGGHKFVGKFCGTKVSMDIMKSWE